MLFLFLLIALFILAAYIAYKCFDGFFECSLIASAVCFFCLIFILVIPFCRLKDKLLIEEIKAVELSIADSRENKNEIERAAILPIQITEINRKLSRAKYVNKLFIGDIYIVDELAEIEYLK